MRVIQTVISFVLFSLLIPMVQAQTNWLLAETIEKTNAWNKPFYKPYNNVDILYSKRTDSAAFCFDCNLASVLWKGIEAGKIPVYMPDKKKTLVLQKNTIVKKAIEITGSKNNSSVIESLHNAACTVYRKPLTDNLNNIQELPIEWFSIEIKQGDGTFIFYVRAKESLQYLDTYPCVWVHPANHYIQLSYKQALISRQYLAEKKMLVSASNLQQSPGMKNALPVGSLSLLRKDADAIAINKAENIQMHLQAICSASILSPLNRGYNKVHLPDILIGLYESEKIKAYTYHEAGYLTPITTAALTEHLFVETGDEDDYTIKRFSTSSLTTIYVLKNFTQLDKTSRISNDWLILGMDTTVSMSFTNTYVIAFSYAEVVEALAGTSYMWYSGTNQLDSIKLEDALRGQRIAYNKMVVSTIYGDTVFSCTNAETYKEYKSGTTPGIQLYGYAENFRADFDVLHNRLKSAAKQASKASIETYQLNYFFDAGSSSVLTQKPVLTDLLIEAIRTKKIKTYSDEQLSEAVSQDVVLSKLDKARFYKTGNKRKDSIYISKIPAEDRYIKSSELTQYTIQATYTMHSKATAHGTVLGIYIPAALNPQYEPEVFCYVSYAECLYFLQKDKTGKKHVSEFTSLLNERAIISVEDFYGVILYDAATEKPVVPGILPPYVRARVVE